MGDTQRDGAPCCDFYDFDEFEAVVDAAAKVDPRALLLVLLGGEAGLRSGEIRALEWSSIDFRRRLLTVERSEYRGHVALPKHDRIRQVPMAKRLANALLEHRHQEGLRVLYEDEGGSLTRDSLRRWLTATCKEANVRYRSPHCLRHTFCSHLAMRGVPARAIQELAGHEDLKTTQRYMHLRRGDSLARATVANLRPWHRRSRAWRHRGDGFSGLIRPE